ncbi:MAG: phosphoribosyltransferase [Acidithiobacillus sp.]
MKSLKADPDYESAKAGGLDAAARLVLRCADVDFLEKASQEFGRDVVYVSVYAEEAQGKNKIPLALAKHLSIETGAGLDLDIVQSNRAYHTGAKPMERLLARAEFAGEVQPGKRYVLVDDVTTMGSTLADLASYIQAQGGEIAGSLVLTNAMRELTMGPAKQLVQKLEVRHGQPIRELFGIEPEALTASEAGYLIGFRSADELRNRAVKARQERSERFVVKSISRNEAEIIGPENSAQPSEVIPNPSDDLQAQRLERDLSHPTQGDVLDTPHTHPPPGTVTLPHTQTSPSSQFLENPMAAQPNHLLSYGPMDVVASNDEKNPGLHVVHMDAENRAFIPQGRDDPLHREIRDLIEKNPHSKGFVANQVHARLEQEGRWDGPGLHPAKGHDAAGLSFSPSMNPEQEKGEALNVVPPARGLPPARGETLAQGTADPEIAEPADATGKKPDQEPQQKTITEPDPLADWPGTSQKSPEPLMPPEKPRFERKNPPEVLFANPKGKPYVLDHGDKVTVTNRAMLGLGHEAAEKRRKAVEIGLKAAVDRFGEPVRFQGNRAFLEETVKVAMERGIALEPGSPMARDIYERAIQERGNQLGPSKDAAPYRAPEKKREVDKGKGIGL